MPIVFVHLGQMRPTWLLANVAQTALAFPDSVYLVSDNRELLASMKGRGVQGWLYEATSQDRRGSGAGASAGQISRGFWEHTSSRFSALAAFHEQQPGPLLHIESDVVLLPGFESAILERVGKCLAYALLAPSLGVGAVVYGEDRDATGELAEFMTSQGAPSVTDNDMTRLAAFAAHYPERVAVLPAAPPSATGRNDTDTRFLDDVWNAAPGLGGVFDGATIGQYLLGLDSRNRAGRRTIRWGPPDHALDPSQLDYRFENGQLSVRAHGTDAWFPVFNLHVHSKDPRAFRSESLKGLLARRIAALPAEAASEFVPRSWLTWWTERVRQEFRG